MENKHTRIFIATIGTFLEWAEFTYYAYISTEIAVLFFPNLNTHLALIATFSVFAFGYFFRPLGGILFGYVGDTFGRRLALQSSMMLMGVSSIAMGCLPTYTQIGIAAPILLLVCRSIQSLAVSGEFNGSAIYLIEHDPKKPCLAGSWTAFSAAFGMMFGSLMSALIHLPAMPAWAWRSPFLLGALSCFCALYFRKHLSESPAYLSIHQQKRLNPLSNLLKNHWLPMIKAIFLIASIGVWLYIMSVYYTSHLAQYSTLSTTQARLAITFGQGLVVLFIAIIARFADHFDEKYIFTLGLKGFFIAAPLAYIVPASNSFSLILLAQIAYALCDALVSVPLFKIINDMFPVQVRYSGISIAWGVSMALFGGTAPLVAKYLQHVFNNPVAPAFYIMLTAGIALLVLPKENNDTLNAPIIGLDAV
ncbi:MAG: MFS transporter [Legionellaceae bacterium]|nr:MFS transporter [Legionellaceae bacterium]